MDFTCGLCGVTAAISKSQHGHVLPTFCTLWRSWCGAWLVITSCSHMTEHQWCVCVIRMYTCSYIWLSIYVHIYSYHENTHHLRVLSIGYSLPDTDSAFAHQHGQNCTCECCRSCSGYAHQCMVSHHCVDCNMYTWNITDRSRVRPL